MPDPVTLVDEFFSDRCLPPSAAVRHARNYSWAELLETGVGIGRFAVPSLFGTGMKIVAAIHAPDSITKILDSLGLPSRAPPVAPACRDSHSRFDDF